MKKIVLLLSSVLSIIACKENPSNTNEVSTSEHQKNVETSLKTYAELSIAQGGEWMEGSRGHKEYTAGTSFKNVKSLDVPAEHTDHSWFIRYEGPGWENNQIGYRIYLDWRNAIDIYGKKVDSLVLPYVGQDGFDSYHEPADWGQDILKAGKSMGIGGYGRYMNDTVAHFRNVEKTAATVENADGNSAVNIAYKSWTTGNETIDLNTVLTIYKQDRYTKATLSPSAPLSGLCTGIVKFKEISLLKKEGEKWGYIATYGAQTLVSDEDKLGMAVFYKLDEVTEQKEGVDDHLVIFKPTSAPVTYYFLGAWEQERNGIKSEADFIADLNMKLEKLNKTDVIN